MIVINEKTLKRFRLPGECEFCGLWLPRREAHHVLGRGAGGGSRLDIPEALCSLCPFWMGNDCHRLHGDDPDYLEAFLFIVAEREGFSSAGAVREYLDLVLRTPKGQPLPAAPVCPW